MDPHDLAEMVDRIPRCVRTLCLFPGAPPDLDTLLTGKGINVVLPDSPEPEAPTEFDAFFIFAEHNHAWPETLAQLLHRAAPNAFVAIFPPPDPAVALTTLGLVPYPARRPRDLSRYTLISIHQKSEDPLLGRGALYVRNDYDPVTHAQALAQQGHPDWAFDILDLMPEDRLVDPVQQLIATLEMQLALLPWEAASTHPQRLRLFFLGQRQFYKILNLRPQNPTAHICQAEAWRAINRLDMAHRILTAFQEHWPDPAVETRLAQLGPRPCVEFPAPEPWPDWPPGFRPRLLLLNHTNSDVGFDALYDGLCHTIGPENVIEYPWKHYLHGHPIDGEILHPAMCNHPGLPQQVDALEAQLKAGDFDAIVYSDIFQLSDTAALQRLLDANPVIPVILLDQQDEGWDNAPRIRSQFPRANIIGQFKREMIQGQPYSPRTVPLPLTYMDCRAAPAYSDHRPHDLFWAGHRYFGMRRLYLEALESSLGIDLDQRLAPHVYAERLGASRIGLDLFGFGFDTIRYWELPAHGCMLLAERKPIVIPFNFQSGQHALFFHTLGELKENLDYCLNHPDESCRIAEAGYHHFRQYHTASARARQFLGQIHAWMHPSSA